MEGNPRNTDIAFFSAAVVQMLAQGMAQTIDAMFEAQGRLNNVRRLIRASQELDLGEQGASMVADVEGMKESEAMLWDSIEKMFDALSPSREHIKGIMDGDEELANQLENYLLSGKAAFAEKRAAALSDDYPIRGDDEGGLPPGHPDYRPPDELS
jgi:hypothetical protein